MEPDNFSALNAITPVRRGWQWWLRAIWRILKRLDRRAGGEPRGVLMRTSMINAAGWSLVRHIPCGTDGQKPQRLERPYLLFEANFSGALSPYLETFSFVDAWGLRVMWQGAYDFPHPAQASRFFDWVDQGKLEVNCCYCAYPAATTSMVRIAIELQSRISRFDAKWRHLPADDFAAAYWGWLPGVQTIRDPPGQAGKTWSFTSVSIINDVNKTKELVAELEASDLAIGEQQQTPQKTHFARITVADKFLQSWLKDEADHDQTSYLMFSTWFDGAAPGQSRDEALESHLQGLHSRFGGNAEDIWGCCRGYTGSGPGYFRKYLVDHEVAMGMPFSTYPGRKVADVKAALALAGKFSEFTVKAQDWGPAKLRREWDFFLGTTPPGPPIPAEEPAVEPLPLPPGGPADERVGDSR